VRERENVIDYANHNVDFQSSFVSLIHSFQVGAHIPSIPTEKTKKNWEKNKKKKNPNKLLCASIIPFTVKTNEKPKTWQHQQHQPSNNSHIHQFCSILPSVNQSNEREIPTKLI
jgi:hypothetical protein